MNAPIGRLFALVLVLFALLVGFTSRWTVFEAEALRDNPNNRRDAARRSSGSSAAIIRAADGEVLAGNRALPQERFGRRYPTGDAVRPRRRLLVARPRPRRASRTTTTTR